MFLFNINFSAIFMTIVVNFSVNSLPSGIYCNNSRQERRGLFETKPKLLSQMITLPNNTSEGLRNYTGTTELSKTKWQVGKVSRKQYEIVNMIWRKTKIFLDIETTTISNYNNDLKKYLTTTSRNTETFNRNRPTESYIEFDYLDKMYNPNSKGQHRLVRLDAEYIGVSPQLLLQNFKSTIANSALESKYITMSTSKFNKVSSTFRRHLHKQNFPFLYLKSSYKNNKPKSLLDKLKFEHSTINLRKRSSYSEILDGETCPITEQPITQPVTEFVTTSKSSDVCTEKNDHLYTTIYDKIKFFEIYDRQTEKSDKISHNLKNMNNMAGVNNTLRDKSFNDRDVQKILLEHVDINVGHHEGIINNKFVKKHINKNEYVGENIFNTKDPLPAIDDYFAQRTIVTKNYSSYIRQDEIKRETYVDLSKPASWSDYSFAAVYVYEPSQVLCDAAAISSHWLITAGSCLSRQHRLELTSDRRSAFVTYCGEAWRRPERIAYVKYTRVHPKFNPRVRSRRFLYNVGVIQVINSLVSACPGLAPVTLMSHQFTTNFEGSEASAVGWGLDRYAAKLDTEIPAHSLMVYNGIVNSFHCPGNIGYSEAKQVEPLNAIKNICCLTLPPYKKEEHDPVHGSLLLIGGKLIALYLQEERRGWGEQSAQYTGVWRLIPWILETAREPQDIDSFIADI